VLRAGFLDGWRGIVYALLRVEYVRRKYVKLWLLEQGQKLAERCPLPRDRRHTGSTGLGVELLAPRSVGAASAAMGAGFTPSTNAPPLPQCHA